MKSIHWIILSILVIAGFYFVYTSGGAGIEPPFEVGVLHPLDNVKGKVDSSVVVFEYSDFECPACRTYYPVMREIMTEFGDRVAFVYRHFPLTTIHANAEFAARASEAARKQGKFWEMHDMLFEKQNEWARVSDIVPLFESYAKILDISVEQFRTDFESSEVKDFVRAQRVHSIRAGLQGTPTFFINGEVIKNPNSASEFRNLINAELAK